MGSAFSIPCNDRNNEVVIFGTHLEDQYIDEINKNDNFHQILNLNFPNNIKFKKNSSLDKIEENPDLLVLGISSKGIDWISDRISNVFDKNKLPKILMLTKGLNIYENKYELLIDKLIRNLSKKNFTNINISAVGGPCLASGLANKINSSVVIANKDIETANWIKDILNTEYYHISTSKDVIGVEACAAIKNIFAMVIGASKGISNENLNDNIKRKIFYNTSASLITQCIYEMNSFVTFLNGKSDTVYGLAGLGDLYVSAVGGRNSKMGSFIGSGMLYSDAIKTKMKDITVEGAELAFEIHEKINQDFKFEKMPLLISMMNSIVKNQKLKINWDLFN